MTEDVITVELSVDVPSFNIESVPLKYGEFTNDGLIPLSVDKEGRFVYKACKTWLRVTDTFHGESRNLKLPNKEKFLIDAYFPIDELHGIICSRGLDFFFVHLIELDFNQNHYYVICSNGCGRDRNHNDGIVGNSSSILYYWRPSGGSFEFIQFDIVGNRQIISGQRFVIPSHVYDSKFLPYFPYIDSNNLYFFKVVLLYNFHEKLTEFILNKMCKINMKNCLLNTAKINGSISRVSDSISTMNFFSKKVQGVWHDKCFYYSHESINCFVDNKKFHKTYHFHAYKLSSNSWHSLNLPLIQNCICPMQFNVLENNVLIVNFMGNVLTTSYRVALRKPETLLNLCWFESTKRNLVTSKLDQILPDDFPHRPIFGEKDRNHILYTFK